MLKPSVVLLTQAAIKISWKTCRFTDVSLRPCRFGRLYRVFQTSPVAGGPVPKLAISLMLTPRGSRIAKWRGNIVLALLPVTTTTIHSSSCTSHRISDSHMVIHLLMRTGQSIQWTGETYNAMREYKLQGRQTEAQDYPLKNEGLSMRI